MIKTSLSPRQQQRVLRLGRTLTIPVSPICELDYGRRIQCSVIVQSTADVAVMAMNSKGFRTDASVVYPTSEWGREYYIITPNARFDKEFSITNGKYKNKVKVSARGPFRFGNILYKKGSTVSLDLKPYETVLFCGPLDFTGTRLSSERPVAVFTGHTCYSYIGNMCSHLYEQLLPVSKWGSTFHVPGSISRKIYNTVFVMASQPTRVNFKGAKQSQRVMAAGDVLTFKINQGQSLYLQADHGIQVLMIFTTQPRRSRYPGFCLTSVLSTDRYCSQYSLTSVGGFNNQALIVAPSNAREKLKLNGKLVNRWAKWTPLQSTDNFWTLVDTNRRTSLSSSGIPFGLYSIGFRFQSAYGTVGHCVQTGKVHALYIIIYYLDLKFIFKKNILLKNIKQGLHFILQEGQ